MRIYTKVTLNTATKFITWLSLGYIKKSSYFQTSNPENIFFRFSLFQLQLIGICNPQKVIPLDTTI